MDGDKSSPSSRSLEVGDENVVQNPPKPPSKTSFLPATLRNMFTSRAPTSTLPATPTAGPSGLNSALRGDLADTRPMHIPLIRQPKRPPKKAAPRQTLRTASVGLVASPRPACSHSGDVSRAPTNQFAPAGAVSPLPWHINRATAPWQMLPTTRDKRQTSLIASPWPEHQVIGDGGDAATSQFTPGGAASPSPCILSGTPSSLIAADRFANDDVLGGGAFFSQASPAGATVGPISFLTPEAATDFRLSRPDASPAAALPVLSLPDPVLSLPSPAASIKHIEQPICLPAYSLFGDDVDVEPPAKRQRCDFASLQADPQIVGEGAISVSQQHAQASPVFIHDLSASQGSDAFGQLPQQPVNAPVPPPLTKADAAAAGGDLHTETRNGIEFTRIIPLPGCKTPLRGFEMVNSSNLPRLVDVLVFSAFLSRAARWSPELRHIKSTRNQRACFTDHVVGFFQMRKNNDERNYTFFALVTREAFIRQPPNVVEVTVGYDEIEFARCYGCAAQNGLCKHVLAFTSWLHYRTIEPSPTEVVCYWKQSPLAQVDCRRPIVQMMECANAPKSAYKKDGSFLMDLQKSPSPSMFQNQTENTYFPTSLHNLAHKFAKLHTKEKEPSHFAEFTSAAIIAMTPMEWKLLKEKTLGQSQEPLWKEMRYLRITASVLAGICGCKLDSSEMRMINKLFGASKLKQTEAMARGLRVEKAVLDKFSKDTKTRVYEGFFFIHSEHPLFGATPDGIAKDFVVEVKCPMKNINVGNYIKTDGTPTKKVLLQILLQMLLSGRKRGILLVADESFEENGLYRRVEVSMDKTNATLLAEAMAKAELFWHKKIYPKMMRIMRPIFY